MRLVVASLVLVSLPAAADDAIDPTATRMEAGVYLGGFISNFNHQFYDFDHVANPPTLDTVNPELGFRFAYFPLRWLGAEAEASWITAGTSLGEHASIFNAHAQAIAQYICECSTPAAPQRLVPFIAVGGGLQHVASPDSVLGSDTDFPLHAGLGARYLMTNAITLRADIRWLRGPSRQDPYTLNASYGELMVGISFTPRILGRGAHEAPPVDTDHDGIADAKDKCPAVAEDKNGSQDDDGCPDGDQDGDGIVDALDKCPAEAEDKDAFHDEDGCPDPDNDSDGVIDAQDKCPDQQETINGTQDDEGCPDRGDSLVVLSPDRIELLDPIGFTGPKLAKTAGNIVGQVALTLRAHAEILRVRISVHVQPSRDAQKDQDLSDKRAEALRDALVAAGVDAKRITTHGFGGTMPLIPADQRGAAAINERVELVILERQ